MVEAYGQTEGSGAATNTAIGETQAGHVGPPNACSEIKLVDVPELNYFASDKPHPRGEICVRGPGIFPGYLKDEKKTRETVDDEGWLHSGDVGIMQPNGTLVVIDRIKNVFKVRPTISIHIYHLWVLIINQTNSHIPCITIVKTVGARRIHCR